MGKVIKIVNPEKGTVKIIFESVEDFILHEKEVDRYLAPSCDQTASEVSHRSQLEKHVPGVWYGHDGRPECPVPDGSDCEFEFRDGSRARDDTPEDWTWGEDGFGTIEAYRIFK